MMSFFDKLKFWKKHDDLGLGDNLPIDMSTEPKDNLGLETPKDDILSKAPDEFEIPGTESSFEQPDLEKMGFERVSASTPQQDPLAQNKDMELISSKLDTIKAELDAMNQRLQKIERFTEDQSDKKKKFSW